MATVVGLTALATAALVLVARGIWGLRRLALISSWPVVHGTVVVPALEEFPPSEGGPTHRPKLTYSYVLNGRTYRSSHLGITSSAFDFFSPEPARAFLARFPPGSRVDISVSPDDPSFSVIAEGASPRTRNHFLTLVVSGGILACCIVAVAFVA